MSEARALWCCSRCGAVYYKDYPRCPNDGGEVTIATRDPLLDQTIGRYVIDELVGEGGMGRVYRAHHAQLANKRYAVKVLLGDAAVSAAMRQRFTREAESASKLIHPTIVGVIDHGATAAGLPYIVMDFVDGTALTDLIGETPMDPARVIRLARAVCEGLAYAHDAGVVHRDLKPDNILVETRPDGDELPRIADFGLAVTDEHNDARLTSTGMAMGTPAYAAPEQMAGKRVDHWADLYALGMTMFEMLTGGRLPFEGSPMEIMSAKAHTDAPLLGDVAPAVGVPIELQLLVARLLRRKPVDRIGSAAEAIAALDDVVLGMALDTRAATVIDRDRPPITDPIRRRRRRGWMVLAVPAVAAVGFAGWQLTRSAGQSPAAAVVPAAAARPAAPAPAPPPAPVVVTVPDYDFDPPAPSPGAAPTRPHHRPSHPAAKIERLPAVTPQDTSLGVAAVPVVPPPVVPPPTPPVAAPVAPRIAGVEVHGSLSEAIVRRAIDRVLPAVRRCTQAASRTVEIRFAIDESRRAQNVRGSDGCLVAAFGGVRTEVAPDVGDTDVVVRVSTP